MPKARITSRLGPCEIEWANGLVEAFFLLPSHPETPPDDPPDFIRALLARVQTHLEGHPQDFSDVPYAWDRVTAFQQTVYRAALRVPAGQTQSYGQLACSAGHAISASRAVGAALGKNPWPLLVPCHRFLSANGRMTGFSAPGGIATKRRLLALEGLDFAGD